jgi:hypothetical protein
LGKHVIAGVASGVFYIIQETAFIFIRGRSRGGEERDVSDLKL